MSYQLDWLERWQLYSPKNIALKDGDSGRELSYAELYAHARSTANYLYHKYQIQPGDRVILIAQNELESVILFFALQRLGASLVPINFRLAPREVEHIVYDSQAKLIVTQPEFTPLVANLGITILQMEPGSEAFTVCDKQYLGFEALPDSIAMILYTSGTTGSPKGAMLSHQMLFWNSVNTSLRLNLTQHDKAVIFLPLFHTGGWNVLLTPFIHRGAQAILIKKFDAEKVLALSENESCTLLFGVPTTMSMMAHHALFKKVTLKSIRYAIVGGEPMSLEHIHIWNQKGVPVRQGYGLTEFGPNVFSLGEEYSDKKVGSIGFANFYVETKVVTESGTLCQAGQVGELCLKGPMMMSGYWNNSQATQETIQDGWLHTGDLVKFDSQGFYYVVGRKKDMFISGGENVYPAEVEQVLSMLPQVLEVAVVGVADDKWGEVGKAFIVTSEPLTKVELLDHCQKNLAKFKVPKHFEFMKELPKGDSGKILKRQLLETQA